MTDCPQCEYHKNRAARWRAEAYKQGGHDVIELPWIGLTEPDLKLLSAEWRIVYGAWMDDFARDIEAKLKEKNDASS